MAENKTAPTDVSPYEFVASVENPQRRADGLRVLEIMREITGEEPRMWGPSMVGFGQYKYRYESGREGMALRLGFSPRKASLVLYVQGLGADFKPLVDAIGPHKLSGPDCGCIYVKRLDDLDEAALRELFRRGWTSRIPYEVTD